ncbi:MAG: hypothetical protein R3D33_08605 [Hyphomicrobiaceae bacterium]
MAARRYTDPLLGIEMPRSVTNKMTYTGAIRDAAAPTTSRPA